MASPKPLATAASSLRSRLTTSLRLKSSSAGPSRWTSPGHQEHPNGYFLNRTPLPPGQSRKWEDWELPCYVTSFLTIVILGVGLNAKPDLTLETWAHQKALERLEAQQIAPISDDSDWDCKGMIWNLVALIMIMSIRVFETKLCLYHFVVLVCGF